MRFVLVCTAVSFMTAACAQVEDFNTSLGSIANSINTDLTKIAANDLPAACAALASLDKDFQAAAAISSAVNAQAANEAVAISGVAALCSGTPPANVEQAVLNVIAAGLAIQTALKAS